MSEKFANWNINDKCKACGQKITINSTAIFPEADDYCQECWDVLSPSIHHEKFSYLYDK